jgi:hypothetical protein
MPVELRRNHVKKSTTFALEFTFAVSIVLGLVMPFARPALAQNPGNNAVYNSTTLAGSPAFIDATVLVKGDICGTINSILTGSTGAVVDARGFLPPTVHGSQPCGSNPFSGVSNPSTVLLPASTILLSTPWILPSNTRIIGEGENTVLRACTNSMCVSQFSGDMIDMGSSSCSPCSGIVVEHVTLDGQSLSVNGIVNSYAQESSYVNDVAMLNVLSTGLSVVGPGANGSGPYSNINSTCSLSPVCPTSPSPVCVSIQATTLGLHGITCVANSTTTPPQPSAAILLDANNNSIENVHIEGFFDGVLIGSRAAAQGNVLLNVYGGKGAGPLTNTVEICNPGNPTTYCSKQSGLVTDLVLLQIESVGDDFKNPSWSATPILDNVTSTEPAPYVRANAYVGMYVIGNKNNQAPGYSRFTASPGTNYYTTSQSGAPTLAIGATAPGGMTCTTPGTIYSNTAGTQGGNNTVFVCKGGNWHAFKM